MAQVIGILPGASLTRKTQTIAVSDLVMELDEAGRYSEQ